MLKEYLRVGISDEERELDAGHSATRGRAPGVSLCYHRQKLVQCRMSSDSGETNFRMLVKRF